MTNKPGITETAPRLAAAAFMLAVLLLQGCAAKTVEPPHEQLRLSSEAQLTYDYLVYMDYRSRLGQLMNRGLHSPQDVNEAAILQQEALGVLNRIIAVEPTEQLYMDKFAIYWASRQLDQARETLKVGLQKYPYNRDLTISLANTYLVDNRTGDAESVLKEYLRKKPDDLTITAQLSHIYLEQKKFAEALDILKSIPQDKRVAQIHYLHGKASAGLGLSRQAMKSFRKAVEENPDFIEAWGELAYMHELEKNYSEAERIYQKMLTLPDSSNHVRLRLIELSLKLNNPEQALKLVLEGPRSTGFLLEAAQDFLNARFYGQASTILDIFAQQQPIPDAYYFFKASIAYEGEEDPNKALEFLNKIKEDSEHFDRSLQFKAHLLLDLKRKDEALEVIRLGQNRFPDDASFYLLEAGLHAEDGNENLANEILLRGNRNCPDDPQILFQLGVNEERRGNIAQTLKYMEQIISRYPDHANALNFVGYLLADKSEQLDRALVLISRANKLEPDNGYIIDSLAWVYYRMGNFEEAWKQINRAVSLRPQQPEIWEHYGDIAAALNKKKEAAEGYRKALKFKPENAAEIQKRLNAL